MEKLPVTAIILTKNEEQMVVSCIETVQWCQEVLVIDSQSTDSTVQLAKRAGAVVYSTDKDSFAERRNYGLSKARTSWVFYLDADERVTPQLMTEIQQNILDESSSVLSLRRKNIHYGKVMQHGGWENDVLERVFKTTSIQGWAGKIHESPKYKGSTKLLEKPLIHLTHRNMVDGLRKTIDWTNYEAELLVNSNVKPVTVFTLLRKTIMEFVRRALFWKGKKDGIEGWIEALVQAMNKFIVYERVWELQQKPSLEEKYKSFDQEITDSWKNFQPKNT